MSNSHTNTSDLPDGGKEIAHKWHPVVLKRFLDTWKSILGDQLEHALSSRSATAAFLTSPHPNFRRGALAVLANYWRPDPALEQRYEMMLIGDDDETVRAHAVSCLIELHRGDKNRGLCRLLAAFVLNESERPAVRRIAYAGILAIQGRKLEQPIWKSMKSCEAGLPEDLDWQLVRDCLRSK